MSSRPPPVPPANRSDKGPGEPATTKDDGPQQADNTVNPDKKGQTANSKVNTTNQGYQQDR